MLPSWQINDLIGRGYITESSVLYDKPTLELSYICMHICAKTDGHCKFISLLLFLYFLQFLSSFSLHFCFSAFPTSFHVLDFWNKALFCIAQGLLEAVLPTSISWVLGYWDISNLSCFLLFWEGFNPQNKQNP